MLYDEGTLSQTNDTRNQTLKTGSIYSLSRIDTLLLYLISHLGVKILSTKHVDARRTISSSREPSNSHQVGLKYKFCFHVHRITSGLFYENSTELDEVDKKLITFPAERATAVVLARHTQARLPSGVVTFGCEKVGVRFALEGFVDVCLLEPK